MAEAMVNYLMLLGWSPPEGREILTWDEIVRQFHLEQVQSSPAYFDVTKLRALNGSYLRAMSLADFIAACQPGLKGLAAPWPPERFDEEKFAAAAPLVQTRAAVLGEVPALVDFLFLESPPIDEQAWAAAMRDPGPAILEETLAAYEQLLDWAPEALRARLEEIGAAHGKKLAVAQAPIRVAVTGRSVGLPLFESLALLGKPATLDRLRSTLTRLERRPRTSPIGED
jgi:glutamyl-tRNA synthetase